MSTGVYRRPEGGINNVHLCYLPLSSEAPSEHVALKQWQYAKKGAINAEGTLVLILFITTATSVSSYIVPRSGEPQLVYTDTAGGASQHCSAISQSIAVNLASSDSNSIPVPGVPRLFVLRADAIHAYHPLLGNFSSLPCEGTPKLLRTHMHYYIAVTTTDTSNRGSLAGPIAGKLSTQSTLTNKHFSKNQHTNSSSKVTDTIQSVHTEVTVGIWDDTLCFVAYREFYAHLHHVVPCERRIYLFTLQGAESFRRSVVFSLREKDVIDRMESLISKRLFQWAKQIAALEGQPDETLQLLHLLHGDWLFDKGAVDKALEVYLLTIGHLETSFVIKKFIESRQPDHLIQYLQAVHNAGLATKAHTTLLLKLISKMRKNSQLEATLFALRKKDSGEFKFDVANAVAECRKLGFSKVAMRMAYLAGLIDTYIRILLEDFGAVDAALTFLESGRSVSTDNMTSDFPQNSSHREDNAMDPISKSNYDNRKQQDAGVWLAESAQRVIAMLITPEIGFNLAQIQPLRVLRLLNEIIEIHNLSVDTVTVLISEILDSEVVDNECRELPSVTNSKSLKKESATTLILRILEAYLGRLAEVANNDGIAERSPSELRTDHQPRGRSCAAVGFSSLCCWLELQLRRLDSFYKLGKVSNDATTAPHHRHDSKSDADSMAAAYRAAYGELQNTCTNFLKTHAIRYVTLPEFTQLFTLCKLLHSHFDAGVVLLCDVAERYSSTSGFNGVSSRPTGPPPEMSTPSSFNKCTTDISLVPTALFSFQQQPQSLFNHCLKNSGNDAVLWTEALEVGIRHCADTNELSSSNEIATHHMRQMGVTEDSKVSSLIPNILHQIQQEHSGAHPVAILDLLKTLHLRGVNGGDSVCGSAKFGAVRAFAVNAFSQLDGSIAELRSKVHTDAAESRKMHYAIQAMQKGPQIFDTISCSQCDLLLQQQPAIHFCCKHSFHLYCLPSDESCPLCLPAKHTNELLLSQKRRSASENAPDEFFKFLAGAKSKDRFALIADHFARASSSWR
eukprot:Lankesteria_metandrocarpae@DN4899_c0_g1_i1.p1